MKKLFALAVVIFLAACGRPGGGGREQGDVPAGSPARASDGTWEGRTSQGKRIAIVVREGAISSLTVGVQLKLETPCARPGSPVAVDFRGGEGEATYGSPVPIAEGKFTTEIVVSDVAARVAGTFTESAADGTIEMEAAPDSGCSGKDRATWTAALRPSAPEPPASSGLVVKRISTTDRISAASPAGTVEVKPDAGHLLMVMDVAAAGEAPVSVPVDQLEASGPTGKVAPAGAAPFSPANFQAFAGFVSGWRVLADAEGREIKIGRDAPEQPIMITVAPGAALSIVYIVPDSGPPLTVTLPGAGDVPLAPRP